MPSLVALVNFCLVFGAVRSQTGPLVETSLGRIRGSSMSSASRRPFLAFRGIPFAKAPTGELRFEDPVAVEPWDGVLDATSEGPTCVQYDILQKTFKGIEDCLALNVYTHSVSDEPRPVMVWIHGGAWYTGSGNGETDIYGPEIFLDKDVVLVTINYRLGPFGFLTTESEEAPGNYGLLDQNLALQWVREHIEHFGGDPEAVTIFGESAGGGSVHFHILSAHSQGLFHRAIAQSGATLCPWALPEAVGKHSKLLAAKLGCQAGSPTQLLTCMRSVKAEDLVATFAEMYKLEMVLGPRIDAERATPFLPAHPKHLISSGQFNQVPLIAGINKNEAAMTIATLLANDGAEMAELEENPVAKLKEFLMLKERPNGDQLTKLAMSYYLDAEKPMSQQLDQLEKLLSDYIFFHPVDEAVRLHAEHSSAPAYYYLYAHRGYISLTSMFGAPPGVDLGVSHGDELFLQFKGKLLPGPMTKADVKVSKMLVDLWTSFAAKGVPQSDGVADWTPTTAEQTRYLNISKKPHVVTDKMLQHERLEFWDQFKTFRVGRDEL